MKNDKTFLLSSFFTIFTLLLLLIISINYFEYKKETHFLRDKIKNYLEICSYKLDCKDVNISFEDKKHSIKPFYLYENKNNFYMYFNLKYLKKSYLTLTLPKQIYLQNIKKIKKSIIKRFLIELIVILIITLFLTYILLIPLKRAYKINEEFIKDIVHDINTPLTNIKLNLFLLKKEVDNPKLKQLENNINRIIKYEENLKTFLNNNPTQIEKFNLKDIIDEKLQLYSSIYPTIKYNNSVNLELVSNKNSFEIIFNNLISNAFKYNKKNGFVKIYQKDKKIYIEDSGIGIKNPKKVFDRFYKESKQGTGIGMNIVKKLCNELNIKIEIESSNKGSTIILDLKNINTSFT